MAMMVVMMVVMIQLGTTSGARYFLPDNLDNKTGILFAGGSFWLSW